jgi:hypothetical protein
MLNIYYNLKDRKFFIDNEYLKKYCQLVERNTRTLKVPRITHKHHIVPRSWFKLMNYEIDDSLTNLVNLPTREHFLAHYYMCLCTEDPFKYANQLALMCLLTSSTKNIVDKQLLVRLPLYNNIYEDYMLKLKSNYKLYEEKDLHDNKSDC